MEKTRITYLDYNGMLKSMVIEGGFNVAIYYFPPNSAGAQMIIKMEKVATEFE